MAGEDINWTGSDGRNYVGYLATPEKPNGGGIIIAHALAGLLQAEREIADRFAELGYVTIAADYIGDGRILTPDEYYPFVDVHTPDPTQLRASLGGAHQILTNHPAVAPDRIAAIGYCFGGLVALELARGGAPLAAIVGLHTPLTTLRPEDNRRITGRVLIMNAASDIHIPWAERIIFEQQMDAAKLDWEMVLFGSTEHGFTASRAASIGTGNSSYSERADRRSWKLMTEMLRETIGPR